MSDYKFGQRLWYGGSFVLGFSGGSYYNTFQIGLAPMVGYKITPSWSFGPRIEGIYQYYKIELTGNNEVIQPFTFTYSGFTRLKFLDQFFGHVEYGVNKDKYPVIVGNDVQVIRQSRDVMFIGAGYNAGGHVSGEISVLYNVLEDPNNLNTPFYIRGGLTVNF